MGRFAPLAWAWVTFGCGLSVQGLGDPGVEGGGNGDAAGGADVTSGADATGGADAAAEAETSVVVDAAGGTDAAHPVDSAVDSAGSADTGLEASMDAAPDSVRGGDSAPDATRSADAGPDVAGGVDAGSDVEGGSITPAFVQGGYLTPQLPQTTVIVPYPGAQTAGNLNIVVVGWGLPPSPQVLSVSDTAGNAYSLAIGPTSVAGLLGQSIYYAENIASAPANAVTVQFDLATMYPDIRILEYSGIQTQNSLDVTSSGTGTSGPTAVAPIAMSAVDLLVGANIVLTTTSGAGSGFTQRILTNPDGDIVEDRVVQTPGSYGATAPLSSPGAWVMQLVSFHAK